MKKKRSFNGFDTRQLKDNGGKYRRHLILAVVVVVFLLVIGGGSFAFFESNGKTQLSQLPNNPPKLRRG